MKYIAVFGVIVGALAAYEAVAYLSRRRRLTSEEEARLNRIRLLNRRGDTQHV